MSILVVLLFLALMASNIYIHLVGIVASFKKAWYVGVAALLVPGFALVIGLAKTLFKKDLLA